jgi:3-oxoacyl-(acyl-carrier-protein) synthase
MKKKIVISGMGIYSPIGKSIPEVYYSIKKGISGISVIDECDVSNLRNNKGGVVKNIDNVSTLNGLRANILLKHAANEAIKDAKLNVPNTIDKRRVGISIGSSVGGYGGFIDQLYINHRKENESEIKLNNNRTISNSDDLVRNIPFSLLSYEIAKEYGFTGGISASVTACAASANAISMGRDLILANRVDAVIVGGVDPITQLTLLGFNSLMAMTKGELKTMDENRTGLLVGEGAACFVLESEESALKRKAKIYAELSGCGIANDAYHVTRPHPEAQGAILAINIALKDAGLSYRDIDYVNLHGTGTKHNDVMELTAIQSIFGEEESVPVSSTKSMMGHTLGAAGAIEAVISIIALTNNVLPPNLNVTEKIKGFNYNLVQEPKPSKRLNHVLSNSFGFGGNCASLIFSRYEKDYV